MRALDRLLDFVCRPLILLLELSELRRDARYSIEAHAAGRLAVNCAKAARYLVVSLACLAVAGWLGYLLVGMVAELGVLEAWPLALLFGLACAFAWAGLRDVRDNLDKGRREVDTLWSEREDAT